MGNVVTIQGCCLLQKPVRVVNTDGKVMVYTGEIVRVADVLRSHPRHYVTEAGRQRRLSRVSMLREDEILKPGLTYVLLPLPRLFTVRESRPSPRPEAVKNCCLCSAGGGFSISPSSFSDDNMDGHREERGVGSLGSFTSETTGTGQIVDPPQTSTPVPSALPTHLQELLNSAEIEWKEIIELNKTWRPDLESIKEEPMKSPPPTRQTLAWLMKVEEMELIEERG